MSFKGGFQSSSVPAAASLKLLYSNVLASSGSLDTGAGGIAAGYNILYAYMILQSTKAAVVDNCQFTLNNDSGAHYDLQFIGGTNTTLSVSQALASTNWQIEIHGANGTSGYPSICLLTIPGYALTTFNKVGSISSSTVDATANDNQAGLSAVGWRSTAAITRLAAAVSGSALAAGSAMYIYGS